MITCGTLAGAIIPELVKVFTSTESAHVKEVVTSSREGGASLNILSGFVAGNFSAYWLGLSIVVADVGRLLREHLRPRRADAGARRVRVRPRRVRLPRHGAGDDRGRLVRAGHRQRAVGVRALGDRTHSRHQGTAEARAWIRRPLRAREGSARGERRRGEYVQGDGEAGPHRHRGRRRHDDDLFDYFRVDQRPYAEPREALAAAPAVFSRAHHRRRGDLLVHRRLRASGDHGRLPRGRVHQGEHQAGRRGEGVGRGQQEGRRDLHAVTRRRGCSTSS